MKFDEMCWNYGRYSHYSHINAQNILKKGDDTEQLLLIYNGNKRRRILQLSEARANENSLFSLFTITMIIMGATRLNGFINC